MTYEMPVEFICRKQQAHFDAAIDGTSFTWIPMNFAHPTLVTGSEPMPPLCVVNLLAL